ncbi:MAG: hypothetical protein JST21_09425 [Bacteroidetes bacterium]|nr:hypothetical protein [Bacteroidota bacterium]
MSGESDVAAIGQSIGEDLEIDFPLLELHLIPQCSGTCNGLKPLLVKGRGFTMLFDGS